MAITSVQDRVISDVVAQPTNEWNTFGPIGGLAPLINCTRRSVEWLGKIGKVWGGGTLAGVQKLACDPAHRVAKLPGHYP